VATLKQRQSKKQPSDACRSHTFPEGKSRVSGVGNKVTHTSGNNINGVDSFGSIKGTHTTCKGRHNHEGGTSTCVKAACPQCLPSRQAGSSAMGQKPQAGSSAMGRAHTYTRKHSCTYSYTHTYTYTHTQRQQEPPTPPYKTYTQTQHTHPKTRSHASTHARIRSHASAPAIFA